MLRSMRCIMKQRQVQIPVTRKISGQRGANIVIKSRIRDKRLRGLERHIADRLRLPSVVATSHHVAEVSQAFKSAAITMPSSGFMSIFGIEFPV